MIPIEPIGIIYTPWDKADNSPIQPAGAQECEGKIVIHDQFVEGLKDLDGFSHLILIYSFDRQKNYDLKVVPFMDTQKRGIFATRSPKRPNHIGISTVRLVKINKNELIIKDADMLNNTPLIDIKPFFEDFDNRLNTKKGWLGNKYETNKEQRSDSRFIDKNS